MILCQINVLGFRERSGTEPNRNELPGADSNKGNK